MYAPQDGTDIGAIVAEIGSHAAKLGFAGEDQPRAYFPSHAGYLPPDDGGMDVDNPPPVPTTAAAKKAAAAAAALAAKREYKFDLGHNDERLEVRHPLKDGLVEDWEMVEQIWQHANKTALSVDLAQTPVMLVERAFNSSKLRQEYAELMFEKFQTPALFLAKDSVLSCFACGKTTGLVVDIGAETTTVAPVQDGWLEAKGLVKSHLGGRTIDKYLLALLEKNNVTVHPFLSSSNNKKTDKMSNSYRTYATLEVVRGLKESVCRMPEGAFNETDPKYASVPKVNYELPDGTVVAAGLERFQTPDVLMAPEGAWGVVEGLGGGKEGKGEEEEEEEEGEKEEGGWSRQGLPKMVAEAVFKCEREQQSALLNSVVLTGGGACVEGLSDRLKLEVETAIYGQAPGVYNRVKVLQPGPQERKICAWLGGSIVASLGSFHEMWISKAEFAERGAGIVDTKCP